MSTDIQTVKSYVQNLGIEITHEDQSEHLLVLDAEDQGIHQLVLDCEEDILVIEQFIMNLADGDADVYRELLQMNRSMVHGALCLDDEGRRVIFRDTLQLENLDLNELEGSINALSLMLAENAGRLIEIANHQGASA